MKLALPSFWRRVQLDEHGVVVERSLGARIRNTAAALILIVLNLVLILRATVSCDIAFSETMLVTPVGTQALAQSALKLPAPQGFSSFTARREGADGVTLCRLFGIGMSDERGHVQVSDTVYFDGADILQFTVRQNLRHYPEKNTRGNPTLSYLLRVVDAEGGEHYYALPNTTTETHVHRGYLYTRVCMDSVRIALGTDYVTLYVLLTDETDETLLTATLHSQSTAMAKSALKPQTYRFL